MLDGLERNGDADANVTARLTDDVCIVVTIWILDSDNQGQTSLCCKSELDSLTSDIEELGPLPTRMNGLKSVYFQRR